MQNMIYIKEKLKEKKVLLAAHQGTFGGNICTNTISSGKNALLHGADIIEADVTRDLDGVLYMFHDAHEGFNFGSKKHIPEMRTAEVDALRGFNANGDRKTVGPDRLDDYLAYFKNRDCIINLDRCWDIWDDVINVAGKYDMLDRIIFKSPTDTPNYLKYYHFVKNSKYPLNFMPIISSVERAGEAFALEIPVIGFEILYKKETDAVVNDEFINRCHDMGLILWSNAMSLTDTEVLAAGYDDNAYIERDKPVWEWHFGKGFDIVQTDWMALWYGFRKKYFDIMTF